MIGDTHPEPPRGGRSRESGEEQRPAPSAGDGEGAQGAAGSLGEIMGQVARVLRQEHGDVEATLQTVTDTAVGAVPGAEEVSISYVSARRQVESRAWTGELAREVDQLQNRFGEGPCLDAIWQEHTVRIDDMATERRWPRFAGEAARLGAGSALSFRLFVEGDALGALNVYAREPRAFGEESEDVGLVLASHAAVAIAGAQTEAHLRTAVSSRDLIGQAKGILMERHRLTADQAFHVLARSSMQLNRKLADVAAELCETGLVPGSGTGRDRQD